MHILETLSNFAPPLDLEVTMAFSILSLVGLLAALAELPFKCLADVPRCDRENPDFTHSPYCLPYDYNLDIIPPMDGPLVINVDIFVFEVSMYFDAIRSFRGEDFDLEISEVLKTNIHAKYLWHLTSFFEHFIKH